MNHRMALPFGVDPLGGADRRVASKVFDRISAIAHDAGDERVGLHQRRARLAGETGLNLLPLSDVTSACLALVLLPEDLYA